MTHVNNSHPGCACSGKHFVQVVANERENVGDSQASRGINE
jgi:hypothetical protein